MAEIIFYQYPASDEEFSGLTAFGEPNFGKVDDPFDALDGRASFGGFRSTGAGVWARWGLTPPQTGVVGTKIRVYYSVFTQRDGVYDLNSTPKMKGVLYIGGAYYDAAASGAIEGDAQGALFTAGALQAWPFYRLSTGSWQADAFSGGGSPTGPVLAYWEWTVNPATGVAFTVDDLQNLQIVWSLDSTKGSFDTPTKASGSPHHGLEITASYVKVFATAAAASIEATRVMGSAYLRFQRDPLPALAIRVPLGEVAAGVGNIVPLTHRFGPVGDGTGWGREQWSRAYGLILEKEYDPTSHAWLLTVAPMLRIHTGLWFPAVTDIGYTEEGQGIPYLDAGGGRTVTRTGAAYVRRQEDDSLFVQVPANKEKWTPEGLSIEDSHIHMVLNSSFSQVGSPHTSWSNVLGGSGTVTGSTAVYLFDASGLRRSCVLQSVGTTTSDFAGVSQGFVQAAGWMRAHFLIQRGSSAGSLFWRLQRSSDSWWWNDATAAWQSGAAENPFTVTAGVVEERYSKPIQMAAAVTYTLAVFARGDGSAAAAAYVFYADVFYASGTDVDMVPTPVPTTTAKVTTAPDIIKTANPASALSYRPLRGTAMLRAKIRWDHDWMADGDGHAFLAMSATGATGDRDVVLYRRDSSTQGTFLFRRVIASTIYDAAVVVTNSPDRLPAFGDDLRIAWRWQQADGELGNPDYSIWLAVRGTNGTTDVLTADATAVAWTQTAQADVWYGHNGKGDATGSFLDGAIRDVEVSPYVLTEDEILRRMGV